jgi:integrase
MKSLSKDELNRLLDIAKRHNERDYLAILVCFNHGLRISELIALDKTNVVGQHLVVSRLKGSKRTTQPLLDNEREALHPDNAQR